MRTTFCTASFKNINRSVQNPINLTHISSLFYSSRPFYEFSATIGTIEVHLIITFTAKSAFISTYIRIPIINKRFIASFTNLPHFQSQPSFLLNLKLSFQVFLHQFCDMQVIIFFREIQLLNNQFLSFDRMVLT